MRLIDADALIISLAKDRSALVNNHVPHGELRRIDEIIWKVVEAPTADVAPVVHGEWLFIANGVEDPECSVCGWAVLSRDFEYRSGLPPYHKYCGHCGAKMERSDT